MEHTHNYPDGSKQMPFEIPDLNDILGHEHILREEVMSEAVDAARSTLTEQLTGLKKSNKMKFEEMVRLGLQPSPTAIIMARVEQLVEMLFDDDVRIGFDLGFEARMAMILDEGLAEAKRQRLTGGFVNGNGHGTAPPGLILPG